MTPETESLLREIWKLEKRVEKLEQVAVTLNEAERKALEWLVKHVNATTLPGVRPRLDKRRAMAVLEKLIKAPRGDK